ncbi:hypothetical protein L195_g040169 [Trifolium pratense]|uniref:Uncharacterized protein n=1 Tax=Trifolium pratense TaxID=57577 RepID=A0A2K3M011_TRIPR|nr:hypothetical protein L195_g040169 [Trifolium pratense]
MLGNKNVICNYYRWEMIEDKDIKAHINEYHKLLEDLKVENINLPDQLGSHKTNFLNRGKILQRINSNTNRPLGDLITHIIIDDTNRTRAAKAKSLDARENMMQNRDKRDDNKKRKQSRTKCWGDVGDYECSFLKRGSKAAQNVGDYMKQLIAATKKLRKPTR